MSKRCASGKVRHTSQPRAAVAARAFARKLNADRELVQSLYAYQCKKCQGWHLTRQGGWAEQRLVFQAPPEWLQRWAMPAEEGDLR